MAARQLSQLRPHLSVRTDLLRPRSLSGNPRSPEFQRANLPLLQQLLTQAQRIKKFYPSAPSTDVAVQIADKYGLSVP